MATYAFKIADLSNTVLQDVSAVALRKVVSPRLRPPGKVTCSLPAHLTTSGVLSVGNRRLIVTRDGTCVANCLVWTIEESGGPNDSYVDVTAWDPTIRWATRWVQDADGQIFDGVSSDGTDRGLDLPAGWLANPLQQVAAGKLIKEAVENTIANDGPMGMTTTGGSFSTASPPALNVAFALRNLTPCRLADLATLLIDAGAVDIRVVPTDAAGETQAVLSAVDRLGTDLAGVSFDYATGDFSVSHASVTSSMDEFCNKLWYELGAREGSHFSNNVTADAPGVTVDDTASRSAYGVYHDIVIRDEFPAKVTNTSNLFKMAVRSYNSELAYRMVPRQILRITPQAGVAPEPWTDYNLGDTPRVNIGAALDTTVSNGAFRVYGWDAAVSEDNVERVRLMLSADTE